MALTWNAANLRPGTYLIESGTHPSIQGPMGLYGILVVTTAPRRNRWDSLPARLSRRDLQRRIPLLFSEIDPVQNKRSMRRSTRRFQRDHSLVWPAR